MLRELPARSNQTNENKRWFFCQQLDLVVWFDDTQLPIGFQLAYNKNVMEHSISWHQDYGYRHYVVDDGSLSSGHAKTPLLQEAGAFVSKTLVNDLSALSINVPEKITHFVVEKLHHYATKSA